ncbi:MAG TPA: aminodeoxychorismate/anthranilate synthase component II [Flavobacteriales bacterium]|jgi:anthranilate synthase component 2|nr:aminodeoxychorismate/anthranilate synthase component II [Flavobacteriales bacterium]
MKQILILDNYDSFTYNLVQYVKELTDAQVDVYRNDAIELNAIDQYDYIIFSPGPGLPDQAGIMIEAIKEYAPKKKMLGVCLGHQAIGMAFGSSLQNLEKVYHGVQTPVKITNENDVIFKNIPAETEVGRYHSWVINPEDISNDLEVTALSDDNQIMAVKHKKYAVWGLQFHPESIMTGQGKQMIKNFLDA